MPARLERQIRFFLEADRLKTIARRTFLTDGSRNENSAEHSWHFALGVLLLREYGADFDVFRALQMSIVHDIVEIDAGDTFVYDLEAMASKTQREQDAANRLFGLLPADQEQEFRALWDEFELGTSPEARFALVIDRLCPVLLNYATQGRAWRDHGVTASQARSLNFEATAAAPEIQGFIGELIDFAGEQGFLKSESAG